MRSARAPRATRQFRVFGDNGCRCVSRHSRRRARLRGERLLARFRSASARERHRVTSARSRARPCDTHVSRDASCFPAYTRAMRFPAIIVACVVFGCLATRPIRVRIARIRDSFAWLGCPSTRSIYVSFTLTHGTITCQA